MQLMSGEHPLDRVLLSAARARNIGVATPVLSFSNTLLQVSSARRTSYSASDGKCEVVGSRVFAGCRWEELASCKTENRTILSMREAQFYSKTYWITPRGSVGGLSQKIVRFFHHRMNVSCQSIRCDLYLSANALGRLANAGTIGEESSQEFQGLGWEGPQEVR